MSKYERLEPVFAELDSGDEHIHPMFNTNYGEDEEPPRRKTPFLVIGSLLVLAFAGGGLVFAYKQGVREGNRTAPPVIKASSKPIKTLPKKPGGIIIPNQNKRVYERLDGAPVKVTERLMPSAEEIMDLPKKPVVRDAAPQSGGIRIENPSVASTPPVLPDAAKGGAAGAGSVKITELPEINNAPLPSHKVDVYTITPEGVFLGDAPAVADKPEGAMEKEGTGIVLSEPKVAPQPAPAPAPPVAAAPPPVLPEKNSKPPIQIGALPEVNDGKTLTERLLEAETRLTRRSTDEAAPAATAPVTRSLDPGADKKDGAMRLAALPPVPRRKPLRPRTAAPLQPARAAPVSIQPAARVKRASRAPAAGGRYVVQVASHRRQVDALAEFAGLKRRFPDIIGNYKPLIQRADLGDRGIYYRLRIGPLASKADAAGFCQSLKAAGKNDCLIRRR